MEIAHLFFIFCILDLMVALFFRIYDQERFSKFFSFLTVSLDLIIICLLYFLFAGGVI